MCIRDRSRIVWECANKWSLVYHRRGVTVQHSTPTSACLRCPEKREKIASVLQAMKYSLKFGRALIKHADSRHICNVDSCKVKIRSRSNVSVQKSLCIIFIIILKYSSLKTRGNQNFAQLAALSYSAFNNFPFPKFLNVSLKNMPLQSVKGLPTLVAREPMPGHQQN